MTNSKRLKYLKQMLDDYKMGDNEKYKKEIEVLSWAFKQCHKNACRNLNLKHNKHGLHKRKIKFYSPLLMSNDSNALDYQFEINEALKVYSDDLAKYADDWHGDSYYTKLHSCKIKTEVINGVLYGVADCEVDGNWDDTDTAQMKKYLEGQYSDGWGEGFAQRELLECEEEYTDTCEDENGEEYEETYTERYGLYCSFWNGSPDWCIKTDEEMKVANAK